MDLACMLPGCDKWCSVIKDIGACSMSSLVKVSLLGATAFCTVFLLGSVPPITCSVCHTWLSTHALCWPLFRIYPPVWHIIKACPGQDGRVRYYLLGIFCRCRTLSRKSFKYIRGSMFTADAITWKVFTPIGYIRLILSLRIAKT